MSASDCSRITRLPVLLVGVSLPLAAQLVTPAFAKARPALKVTKLTAKPATMLAGGKLTVTDLLAATAARLGDR